MSSLPPRASAFTELLLSVLRLHGLLIAAGDELARPVGLSSARWQVLGVVEHGAASVSDIAKAMCLKRQSVQETVTSLAEGGFVAFEDNPRHRRAKLVVLTAKGRRALDVVIEAHRGWATRIGKAASLPSMQSANEVLRALETALSSDATAEPVAEKVPSPRRSIT